MPKYEKKLADDQAREILRLFYEDKTEVGTLDLLFPVSKSTIYAILQGRAYLQAGFDYGRFPYGRPPANKKRDAATLELARRMRAEGSTYKQIADRVGVHLVTVRDWLVS